MKKFAIIIVNYNSAKDTLEAIKSLDVFDKNIFDVFLVDNASKKEDIEVLKKWIQKNIIFIELKENLWFAGWNNVAIKKALDSKYEYIFLLNPDTIIDDINFFNIIERELLQEKADIIWPLIKYYPEKDKIYFAWWEVSKYIWLTKMIWKKQQNIWQFSENKEYDFITGCAMIVKREVFEKIWLLPEEYFLYFEETDFCLWVKLNWCKIIFTPKTYIYHKVSTSIWYLSNTYLYYMIRNFKKFWNKYVKNIYKPVFYFYYIFIWCVWYFILSILKWNYQWYKYILKWLFNKKY